MTPQKHYIGLMSGTSVDAVDAVLLTLDSANSDFQISGHHSKPIPIDLRSKIHQLSYPGNDHINLLGETDILTARLFAKAASELISGAGLMPGDITAIGSHGQTIRHNPPSANRDTPFTLQIGDPNTIAAITGITTVADFRRKDIALGGEAAPLAPAFHQAIFRDEARNRAVINIGGIANITWLPAKASLQPITGFDTGPGNCLMDAWISHHQGSDFDNNGGWARQGNTDKKLLDRLLTESYLSRVPPKSTGKELFNLQWLEEKAASLLTTLRPEDIQATLCEYTAKTIADALNSTTDDTIDEIYICGGGAFNGHLMTLLGQHIPDSKITSTDTRGIHPLHVEGAAFAWLAHQTLNHLPGNLPEVTGAIKPAILGGVYLP